MISIQLIKTIYHNLKEVIWNIKTSQKQLSAVPIVSKIKWALGFLKVYMKNACLYSCAKQALMRNHKSPLQFTMKMKL
jgi:hypothetical protein